MGVHSFVQDLIKDAVDLSTTFVTSGVDVRRQINCSFNCICTGSPSGTFTVQWSNDDKTYRDLLDGLGNAVALTVGGSAENLQFDLTDFSYGYLRLSYASGGTGAADIIYQAKSLG